jgi:O-methyltransferase involved in polyketide biosynthesis
VPRLGRAFVPQPAVALDVTDAEISGKLAQVSKTAVLTLRARADEQHRPDRVLLDPVAAEWMARLPWPPELDGWYQNDAQGNLALRADDVDQIVRRCVAQLGTRVVVELGCGLSTRRQRLAELSQLEWLDVDLPPMIALREALGAPPPHVAGSVLDLAWLDVVPNSETPPLLIAEGLLYYLPRTEVDRLFAAIAARLPGAVILFDVVGVDDFPRLLENSSSVGAPVAWKLERNFDQVLLEFGLDPIPEFDPDELMKDALSRYWHRFNARTRGLIYFAMGTPEVWARRSGMVLGRFVSAALTGGPDGSTPPAPPVDLAP